MLDRRIIGCPPHVPWKNLAREHIQLANFDVVITNPPFGKKLKIDDTSILSLFDLGHKWSFKTVANSALLILGVPGGCAAWNRGAGFVHRDYNRELLLMDFENARYITWSNEEDSVVISLALYCPANCRFCYTNSILEKKEELIIEGSSIGELIAISLCNDPRFIKGSNGTNILMGGFSDPLHKDNTAASIAFINTLKSMSVDNIIHIATRFCTDNDNLIKVLCSYDNLIMNYSVNSMNSTLSFGKSYIKQKFQETKKLSSMGIRVALYIKPVIPEITIKDVPEIIKLAKNSGINHVTVGGLFFDDRILNSLISSGIEIDAINIRNSKFILDKRGILNELDCQDVDLIKCMFKEAGFEVFSSSREISNYFKKKSTKALNQ